MANFFLELVNMSITASYLIVAVVVLRLVLTKAPKWIRGILWGLVGIRLVIPFSFESTFSLIPRCSPNFMLNDYGTAIGMNSGNQPEMWDFSTGTGATPQSTDVVGTLAPATEVSQTGGLSFTTVLAIVWLVGMVAMLVYCAVSYFRLNRRMSDAVIYYGFSSVIGDAKCAGNTPGRKYTVYQSEKVVSPFVLGIFAPRIYLPYKMDAADMDCVIAHEQAHIARKDHWIKPIAFIILAVYWFNPLVWLAYILLCRDIELACDEKVIKEMSIEHKKRYSEALLKCSVPQRMISACPLAFGEVGVKKRIVNILNYKKPAFWIIIVSLVLCVIVAVCFMTKPKDETEDSQISSIEEEEKLHAQMDAEAERLQEQLALENFETITSVQILKEPPTLTMQDALSSTMNFISVESGTYSWSYPANAPGEMVSKEASGAFPSVAVKGKEDEWIQIRDYNGIDYAPYMLSWGIDPDRIQVVEYDLLDLGDMKPEVLSEQWLEDVYFLELRPRRIYEVIAEWDEGSNGNGFYGQATYIFATDNDAVSGTASEGEEQAVIIQATVKDVMIDSADKICISSDTEDFPGAFVVRIPEEVYPKETLQGGQQIALSMFDTGEMYDEHLPLYEALIVRVSHQDERDTIMEGENVTGNTGEENDMQGMNLPAVTDTPWTEEVNMLDGVSLTMFKYKDVEGELEIANDLDRELQAGEWFTIQRKIDGEWYDLAPIADIAFHQIAYSVPAGEGFVLPVKWEYMYGALPVGEYRVVTKVHDWRAPGDYDEYYLADEFEIMKSY